MTSIMLNKLYPNILKFTTKFYRYILYMFIYVAILLIYAAIL